jgi:hypothetical protein
MSDGTKQKILIAAIARDVTESFETHPMRHQTAAEHKRRTNICYMAFKRLRNDHGFSFQRACDQMFEVLKAALDKLEHQVSKRNGWFAR